MTYLYLLLTIQRDLINYNLPCMFINNFIAWISNEICIIDNSYTFIILNHAAIN